MARRPQSGGGATCAARCRPHLGAAKSARYPLLSRQLFINGSMNRICSFASKGGAGKTTLAVLLAVGLDLPLCDLDPQRTATAWLGRRSSAHPSASLNAGRWIADCPPGIVGELIPALRASDLVVIPVRPAFNDLEALPQTVRFVTASTQARVAFTLSDIDRRTSDERTVRELLAEYGYPVLGMLSSRAAYRRAGITGHLPGDFDRVARDEMASLVAAVKDLA